jgi:hypothetical protein
MQGGKVEGQKVEVLTDILPLEFATLIGQSRCATILWSGNKGVALFTNYLINQVNATMEQCLQV